MIGRFGTQILFGLGAALLPFTTRGVSAEATTRVLSTSVSVGDPRSIYRLLAGEGSWKTEAGTQFAKLEIRFEAPVTLTKVEVAACEGSFTSGAELYVNFDEKNVFSEGGKSTLVFTLGEKPQAARTLSVNFRYNAAVCVKSLRLFSEKTPVQLKSLKVIDMIESGPAALFDGRLESFWVPDQTAGTIVLKFASETSVESLRVWNGDQRSAAKYKIAPRVKTLSLAAEGYAETVALADRAGEQTIPLKKPFKGKALTASVVEAHGGEPAQARLTEVQFGASDGYFVPDVSSALIANAEARKSAFQTAKLEAAIDRTLVLNDDGERWAVRVRSDGSFFMRGHSENLKEARAFSFLGSYSIVEASKRGVRLRVDGVKWNPPIELDSLVCGRECAGEPGPAGFPLLDEVSFGKAKENHVFVRDEGPRRGPGLEFRALKARIAVEDE